MVARKASNQDILRLNALGLSLKTIGEELSIHPTTVTQRLHSLGVQPADTRRSFMEDIYNQLSPQQRTWLADRLLENHTPVKDFVRGLVLDRFLTERMKTQETDLAQAA